MDKDLIKLMSYALILVMAIVLPVAVMDNPVKYLISIVITVVGICAIPVVCFVKWVVTNIKQLWCEFKQEQEDLVKTLKD